MRGPALTFLLLAALPLGGCAAGLAAGAIGAAARSATEPSVPEGDLAPAALAACRERAAQHGEVHIIDVERRSTGRVIVWGTVQDSAQRRSFECRYDGEVDGFTLRAVRGR
ncbi:hypothetical protein [Allosphingosinicella sp.]|jgi:hypothetical protein|uniref:hypothetical protein n=1 Tax=Allosphingosinicella sp. TaxID=2823234 RepID=UPI002F10564F